MTAATFLRSGPRVNSPMLKYSQIIEVRQEFASFRSVSRRVRRRPGGLDARFELLVSGVEGKLNVEASLDP